MTDQLKKGDYVLATKFHDGDPGDNWAVGFYDRQGVFGTTVPDVRHFVVDGDGKQFRGSGFRRAAAITREYGMWLLSIAKELEKSPPGSVNLWGMMGSFATPNEEDDD